MGTITKETATDFQEIIIHLHLPQHSNMMMISCFLLTVFRIRILIYKKT